MSAYRQKRFFFFLPVLPRSFSLLAWSHWCKNDFYSQANKIIFTRKILHYGSFWSWELLELGNGQLLGRLLFIHLIQWTFSESRFNWCPDKSTIIYDFRDFKTMRQNLGKTPVFFCKRHLKEVTAGNKGSIPYTSKLLLSFFFLPLLRKKDEKNAFSTFLCFFMGWLLRKCGNMCPGVVATRDTVWVR